MQAESLHNEQQLLYDASQGDRAAFTTLYRFHLPVFYKYIFPFFGNASDTDDLIQQIFVHIWEKRDQLRSVNTFRPYLFRMGRNRFLNQIRDQRVLARITASYASMQTQDEMATYESPSAQHIKEAVDLLTQKRKRIFLLRTINQLTHEKIATSLGISKSVVKKQLHSASAFIRQYVRDHEKNN